LQQIVCAGIAGDIAPAIQPTLQLIDAVLDYSIDMAIGAGPQRGYGQVVSSQMAHKALAKERVVLHEIGRLAPQDIARAADLQDRTGMPLQPALNQAEELPVSWLQPPV